MNEKTPFNAKMKKYFSESVEMVVPPSYVRQPAIMVPRSQIYAVIGSFAGAAFTFWAADKFINGDKGNKPTAQAINRPR
jgi:hypothetical protein